MCDYSLHHVASRPAKVGDELLTTRFRHSVTRGFALRIAPTPLASPSLRVQAASRLSGISRKPGSSCGGVSLALESAGLPPMANSNVRRLLGLAIRPHD
jgi:hypothetical protein